MVVSSMVRCASMPEEASNLLALPFTLACITTPIKTNCWLFEPTVSIFVSMELGRMFSGSK